MIYNVRQGSEEWEQLRRSRATASQFHRIITPAKLQLASGARSYAIEKAAEILGIESERMVPSFWMERGTELEPQAFAEFARTVQPAEQVGFVTLDEIPMIGCSPDGLVGNNGILEIKCPKSETLIEWILDGVLPSQYRMQVQGEMWITGRSAGHFFGWHPEIEPFHIVVERDEKVIAAFEEHLPVFLGMVKDVLDQVRRRPSVLLETSYEAEEMEL
jgi:putative phage-type endonuclease